MPQPNIVDTCDMAVEYRGPPGIIARDDCLADLGARPAKETWRRRPPPQPDRVNLIGHGGCRRFDRRVDGNGEPQQKQQPFPNSTGAPVLRSDLPVRCETGAIFGLIFGFGRAPSADWTVLRSTVGRRRKIGVATQPQAVTCRRGHRRHLTPLWRTAWSRAAAPIPRSRARGWCRPRR